MAGTAPTRTPPPFELTGGRLCLDFANTVDNRPSTRRKDLLDDYGDLLRWGRQTGILSAGRAVELGRIAAARPRKAEAALRRAKELREAIYGILTAAISGGKQKSSEMDALNTALRDALARSRVVRTDGGFTWEIGGGRDEFDQVLWPVARDALELLLSDELPTVRMCAADPCAWLFLDNSRNGSRRWCDMKVCGNRDKVRRFRRRAASRKA